MRQCSVFAAWGVSSAILASLTAACGGTGSSKPPLQEVSSDAGAEDDGPDDTSVPPRPQSFLRFADWTPDAVMGFDVCLAAHGSGDAGAWVGPLLGSALAFPNVSTYISVPADTYDVSVVLPGGTCAASLAPAAKIPALAEGARTTVALVGDLQPIENDPQASVVVFADDLTAPDGQAAVRFIDALGGGPVVFGTGTLVYASFSPLTGNVRFGTASTSPASGHTVDANGYVLLAPLAGATLSAHAGGSESDASTGTVMNLLDSGLGSMGPTAFGAASDLAKGSGVTWMAGSVITVTLVAGNFGVTPQLMLCQDTVGAAGGLTACSVLSQ
jgi:hypothetical protein